MAPRRGRNAAAEADPEVEAALRNLQGNAQTGDAFVAAPEGEKSLEELNGVAPAPAEPHINRRQYDMPMRTVLEGPEMVEAKDELLAAMNNVDTQEAHKAAVMAEWKSIIAQAEEKVQHFRKILDSGKEEVVRVEEVKDFDAGTKKIFRLDTGAQVGDTEQLDPNEQRDLDLDAPAAAVSEIQEAAEADGEKKEGEEGGPDEAALAEALAAKNLERPAQPEVEEE